MNLRTFAILGALLLGGCGSIEAGLAKWAADGAGSVLYIETGDPAVDALVAQREDLQARVDQQQADIAAADVQIEVVGDQNQAIAAFSAEKARLLAANTAGLVPVDDRPMFQAIVADGQQAQAAMVAAEDLARERAERDALGAVIEALRNELNRIGA